MLVAPSILSADWARLDEAVRQAEAGADWLHCDVMDGHFVPNLTFGPTIVAALHRMTRLPLDVHLMIDEPLRYAQAFAGAGARVLTVHVEAPGVAGRGWPAPVVSRGEGGASDTAPAATTVPDRAPAAPTIDLALLRATLARVRALGVEAGLALRPDTPFEAVEAVLEDVDLLLVMTVYPGFSGQQFLAAPLETLRQAARAKRARGFRYRIEVDGGIEAIVTGPQVAQAGAEIVVAGHGVYRQPDPLAAMRALKALTPVPAHEEAR